jgi:hypothetical protein
MKPTDENDAIRQTLQQAMPDDLPPTVEQRMTNQLAAFRRHADAKSPTPGVPSIRSLLPRRLAGWATAALATAILLVAMLFLPQAWHSAESFAWADVVKAVAKKPWLHVTFTCPENGPKPGNKGEIWFSADRVCAEAFKSGPIAWLDFRQNTMDTYDPDKNSIVRTGSSDSKSGQSELAVFRALLSADAAQIIRAGQQGQQTLVHQQQRVVTEDGKQWIEHRLRYALPDDEKEKIEREMVLCVNRDTRLPFRVDEITRYRISSPPKVDVFQWNIDYPDAGPADMYALGVPRTAKLLEPVKADARQLMANVHSTRWQSGKCQALIVESSQSQHWSQCLLVYRLWWSGPCWKADRSWGAVTRPDESVPKGADPATWWRAKTAGARFISYKLYDGNVLWEYNNKTRLAWVESDALILISQEKEKARGFGNWDMDAFSSTGRPLFPIHPSEPLLYEATVNRTPKSGPPNTVQLELRNSTWKPGQGCPPQFHRYWIDPARSHLVVREEEINTVNGKEIVERGFAIEDATQDPNGQWHPAVMRLLKGAHSGKTEDYILRFYYDFNAPIPDSMFETATAKKPQASKAK